VNILVFSPQGDGVGLALQLMAEGHQVAVHFVDENDAKQGKGMLWVSQDWQADARQADFVFFDFNGHGEKADNLRKSGIKVWNGGVIADRLESDRPFGMAVMRKAGIPIPETWDFKNYAEAVEIVNANFKAADRPVVKLNNGAAPSTSYVGRDKADLLAQLESWEEDGIADIGQGGIIQRYVEGIEFSVEGFFDGEKFRYPYNWTMEEKRLLNDNLGPNVGCAWNATANIKARHPKIARRLLEPLVPLLRRAGYTGQIDANSIVSEEDGEPYCLEWTPRPGYDATSTIAQTYPGYGEAIARCLGLSEGETLTEGAEHPFWMAVATRIWVPPYPFEAPTKPMGREVYKCIEGVPVNGHLPITEFVPYDVMKLEESEDTACAGTCGVLGIAMGLAPTVEKATRQSYLVAEKVEAPNMGYRTDGGERVKRQLPAIESLGLLH